MDNVLNIAKHFDLLPELALYKNDFNIIVIIL